MGRWARGGTEGTYLNMHRRFPSDMKSDLGESLHILKSRRFVCPKGMCSGIYHKLSILLITSLRTRQSPRKVRKRRRTYNAVGNGNPALYNVRNIPLVMFPFQAEPRMGVGPEISFPSLFKWRKIARKTSIIPDHIE
jgi:hypothetical protein